jgi:pimeloyl-ACP methyl ester carboxylesterase
MNDAVKLSEERVELPAGPIRFRSAGEGEPIVFVHGFGANGKLWTETARRLAAGGHRCIVPDWPLGSHREPAGPGVELTPRGVARLVVSFLEQFGIERATLVGNDSGGAILQILATETPERLGRLVLTNCDSFEKFPPGRFKALATLAGLPGMGAIFARSLRLGAFRRSPLTYGALSVERIPEPVLRSFTDPMAHDPAIRAEGLRFFGSADPRDTLGAAERLPELRAPVLLAWGVEDRFFTLGDAHRLAERIPDATLVEIPGAATFTPLDRPAEVAAAIAGFIAARPLGTGAGSPA